MPTKQEQRIESDGQITIPVVNATIPVRRVEIPIPMPAATTEVVAYGALAGLALVGVVEWPIALLVGLGYAALSGRRRK